jgi:hypothetical protein
MVSVIVRDQFNEGDLLLRGDQWLLIFLFNASRIHTIRSISSGQRNMRAKPSRETGMG